MNNQPSCVRVVYLLTVISMATILVSCDFGDDGENKRPNPIDSLSLDSSKNKNNTTTKHIVAIDTSLKDTSIQGQLTAAILKLPELKREALLLDSTSKGKTKLAATLSDTPLETDNLYNVKVSEKTGNESKVRYDFYIDKDTREIKLYDAGEDRLITLDEWRKSNE